MAINDELKRSLSDLDYGNIATVAMIDRGPYAEVDEPNSVSKQGNKDFADFSKENLTDDEDLIVVQREDEFTTLTQADFDNFTASMTAEHHIIFVECIELGTTEIRGFLMTLLSKKMLSNSKVILLDLPQLEYMMLKDQLAGQIEL
ncbi:hypothetical protein ACFO26_09700 [Lactococcus nasutitermitis]|uniref:Protein required for attachment to host cells n=1 Tax=Lactococcus nasutitermitis TaxID=1652957 RepID=A0ABV9JFU7_9LACT|nr:hypothetical protein [Lactococcus nasutitermitis]